MLFLSTISSKALDLLKEFQELPLLEDFYLVEDIAAMKLNSTMNRGSKKDFFDIYELLKHFPLEKLLEFHSEKYNFSSRMIVLKSLVYFEDAEKEPDPVSENSTTWELVKKKMIQEVGAYSK
jgi:predicted nucleotidyltransferase component of viral defense system